MGLYILVLTREGYSIRSFSFHERSGIGAGRLKSFSQRFQVPSLLNWEVCIQFFSPTYHPQHSSQCTLPSKIWSLFFNVLFPPPHLFAPFFSLACRSAQTGAYFTAGFQYLSNKKVFTVKPLPVFLLSFATSLLTPVRSLLLNPLSGQLANTASEAQAVIANRMAASDRSRALFRNLRLS